MFMLCQMNHYPVVILENMSENKTVHFLSQGTPVYVSLYCDNRVCGSMQLDYVCEPWGYESIQIKLTAV